jgi:hypothetical protein
MVFAMRTSTLLLGVFLTLAPTTAFAHFHRERPGEPPPPPPREAVAVQEFRDVGV